MRRLHATLLSIVVSACASSETRSIVSKADIPPGKYKNIALQISNLDDGEQRIAEQIIISSLRDAGVSARSFTEFLGKGRSPQQSVQQIQKQFDAVLYVAIVSKGITADPIPNARHNGEAITFSSGQFAGVMNFAGSITIGVDEFTSKNFILNSDGSVSKPKLSLQTELKLQDTQSNNIVWTAETIAAGPPATTNMTALFDQAAHQIVEKMRDDSTI